MRRAAMDGRSQDFRYHNVKEDSDLKWEYTEDDLRRLRFHFRWAESRDLSRSEGRVNAAACSRLETGTRMRQHLGLN